MPVLSIVRLIHGGSNSEVEKTVALSLTHKPALRVEYFLRAKTRDSRANPFDNFAPVSYDNAPNLLGRNLSLTVVSDSIQAAVAQLVERRIRNA